MSEHPTPHAADGTIGPHGTDDHGDGHDHDDHGHGRETLGPIDVAAWAAGGAGIVLGLIVAACLAISSGLIGV